MSEADAENTTATDHQFSEVSLRAVELLARAQRTADEAVAEAQAYARDLEASARAQYAQILQRAQVAARGVRTGQTDPGGTDSAVTSDDIDYVRTYARVAHAQLKTVLSALTDELDALADMAAGRAPRRDRNAGTGAEVEAPGRPADGDVESSPSPEEDPDAAAEPPADNDADHGPAASSDGRGDGWAPIFSPAEVAADGSGPSSWRSSFQPGRSRQAADA